MTIVKLVTKEGNPNVVSLIEDLLEKAKKGDIVAMITCCATPSDWELNISEGTPMLEAMGYINVLKDALMREYMDEQ